MQRTPNPASQPATDGSASPPRSRERDLILAALQQVDRATSWTSRPTSDGVAEGTGNGSAGPVSPDAPTAAEASDGSASVADALPPKDAFAGYEIHREIHRGGQGVVYLATQLATRRRVAIKVMHGGAMLGSTGRVRFEREVHLLGQLNHPNIVKLHDSGVTADGSFYYVMDYVSGRALDEVLREQRKAAREALGRSRSRSRDDGLGDIGDTLRFFAKICDGVNAAHLKGVTHRDIKPANIRVDRNGEPVLVDFGLAKVTAGADSGLDPSNPMTMTGQFIGSLPWASPEQAVGSGDAIDLRSDVYSLGVMLYQLLTGGRFPYDVVGNMRDVLDNIQRAEPTRPSTIRRQINDEVETIVLKALAKERDRRYQSAGELARDIRRYLRGEPIEAKRDAGWYVIRKSLKRHKAAVAFAAGFGIIITGSAIGMTGMWRQAEGARAVAVAERDRAEDNLDAVRDLAQTFLYDFSDAIKNLRGATKARELVLTKALEYLDMLHAQGDERPETVAALADAHERVGDLYGRLYGANMGSTEQAAQHYETTLELRQKLVKGHPDDMLYRAALAGAWLTMGECRIREQDFPGAMTAFQTGLSIAEQAGDTRMRLRLMTHIADMHRRMAVEEADNADAYDERVRVAGELYRTVDGLWAEVAAEDTPRQRAVILSKQAQLLLAAGRVALNHRDDPETARRLRSEGDDMLRRAMGRLEQLLAAEPANRVLARDLWVVRLYLGQSLFDDAAALEATRQLDLAMETRLRALDAFTTLRALAESLAMELSDIEAQRDLTVTLTRLGNTLRELDRLTEARSVFAESANLAHSLYLTDPIERHLRDLGVAQYKVAEVDELLAEQAKSPAERRAILRLARTGYTTALETFREYGRRGGPATGVSASTQKAIDRIDAALAEPPPTTDN